MTLWNFIIGFFGERQNRCTIPGTATYLSKYPMEPDTETYELIIKTIVTSDSITERLRLAKEGVEYADGLTQSLLRDLTDYDSDGPNSTGQEDYDRLETLIPLMSPDEQAKKRLLRTHVEGVFEWCTRALSTLMAQDWESHLKILEAEIALTKMMQHYQNGIGMISQVWQKEQDIKSRLRSLSEQISVPPMIMTRYIRPTEIPNILSQAECQGVRILDRIYDTEAPGPNCVDQWDTGDLHFLLDFKDTTKVAAILKLLIRAGNVKYDSEVFRQIVLIYRSYRPDVELLKVQIELYYKTFVTSGGRFDVSKNLLNLADSKERGYYDLVTLVKIDHETQRVKLFRAMLAQMRVKVDPVLSRMMSEMERWACPV